VPPAASRECSRNTIAVLRRDNRRKFSSCRPARDNDVHAGKSPSASKKNGVAREALIDKETHLAHTIDITSGGARLGALRQELKVGTIVTLQRGPKKAKFRIAWVRQLAPTEAQAGVEAVHPHDELWGVGLSDRAHQDKNDRQAFLMVFSDTSKSRLARTPL